MFLAYIFQHVPETIERTGKGLGVFSAQAFKAKHPDFLQTYQRFKVDPEHKDYGKKFKASVYNYDAFCVSDN